MLQTWHNTNISESHKVYQRVAETVFGSEDAKEKPIAFAEKREPIWKGQ